MIQYRKYIVYIETNVGWLKVKNKRKMPNIVSTFTVRFCLNGENVYRDE